MTVDERRGREADVVRRRADEAREVAALMGTKSLVLLNQPDTALAVTSEAVDALTRALRDARPEVVYVPWPLDAHRDHRVTFALAAAALQKARLPAATTVRLFEVWTPLSADVAVDITAEWETKEECLHALSEPVRLRRCRSGARTQPLPQPRHAGVGARRSLP